jgi:hypothetical protein
MLSRAAKGGVERLHFQLLLSHPLPETTALLEQWASSMCRYYDVRPGGQWWLGGKLRKPKTLTQARSSARLYLKSRGHVWPIAAFTRVMRVLTEGEYEALFRPGHVLTSK